MSDRNLVSLPAGRDRESRRWLPRRQTQLAAGLLAGLARLPVPCGHRVGASIIDVSTLAQQLTAKDAGQFLAATFTPSELAYCGRITERLAARLAAKKAVAAVVGADFDALPPRRIEVALHPTGQPYVRAAGGQPWLGDSQDWLWSVSLAHEIGLAIAIVIARPISSCARRHQPGGTAPVQRLPGDFLVIVVKGLR